MWAKVTQSEEKTSGTQVNALRQIAVMTRLEMRNLYGFNTLRHTRDRKAKRKSLWLLAVWIMLLAVLVFYIGGLSYGLITLNLKEVVPAYLTAISSMVVFLFGMLKAGSTIFRREGYDQLCAMPVSGYAIVMGRLAKMYVEYLLLCAGVLLPGIGVYGWMVRPGWGFYGTAFLGIWFVPLIPISAAVFLGALITGISGRMRYKSQAAAGLSILAVLGILYGTSRLAVIEEDLIPEMLREMSEFVFMLLEKIYPPAVWLGRAIVRGDFAEGLLWAGFSLFLFAVTAAVLCVFFRRICGTLFGSFARHNYEMGTLKEKPVFSALCRREFKRYFSSSIYVTNTILGPVMGCILSGMLLAAGPDTVRGILPAAFPVESVIPFLIAGVFSMMPTTATSISLEGKHWWLVKSLPLSLKEILNAKIGMNLLLILPFYLVSEALLAAALKPGPLELLWALLIPAVLILFSCVYGITVNLRFPVMNWENEVSVVKQSASALLGALGGILITILCIAAHILTPEGYTNLLNGGLCALLLLLTAVLYGSNNRAELRIP